MATETRGRSGCRRRTGPKSRSGPGGIRPWVDERNQAREGFDEEEDTSEQEQADDDFRSQLDVPAVLRIRVADGVGHEFRDEQGEVQKTRCPLASWPLLCAGAGRCGDNGFLYIPSP